MKYRVWQTARVQYTIVVEANNPQDASDKASLVDVNDWQEADFDSLSWEVELYTCTNCQDGNHGICSGDVGYDCECTH